MNFWGLNQPPTHIALIEAKSNKKYTYGELQTVVQSLAIPLNQHRKSLGFIFCRNNAASICGYLAALQNSHTVYLLSDKLNRSLVQNLISTYHPDWLWLPEENEHFADFQDDFTADGYILQKKASPNNEIAIYPELAVLLSTSGSTGSPKLVRLSYNNLTANAASIASYLALNHREKAMTTLPMNYSYGLSVINSHLYSGATLLLTDDAIITKPCWDFFREYKATSFAGVPYTYQMLHRLNINAMKLPSLKTMTQAGGRLDTKLQQYFAEYAQARHIKFFVMYGQTEATARMSYVPPEKLLDNLGSIGIPIPQGQFTIDSSNELIYSGPNVMLGYAECRNDLALGDVQQGTLKTGDLARKDEATGLFYIIGRKKRFLKLVGLRINLDELEQELERCCQANCYCIGKDDQLIVIIPDETLFNPVKTLLSHDLKLHASLFTIKVTQDIPHLSTGKTDYKTLQKRFLS